MFPYSVTISLKAMSWLDAGADWPRVRSSPSWLKTAVPATWGHVMMSHPDGSPSMGEGLPEPHPLHSVTLLHHVHGGI